MIGRLREVNHLWTRMVHFIMPSASQLIPFPLLHPFIYSCGPAFNFTRLPDLTHWHNINVDTRSLAYDCFALEIPYIERTITDSTKPAQADRAGAAA
jgi:hypothetical protein